MGDFFDDIDSQVRNSFFHFSFKFKGNKIYCQNNPKKYFKNTWRTKQDNNQSDFIYLSDLLTLMLNVDRSILPLMSFIIYKNELTKKHL